MIIHQGIVCFLDLLGYKEMVKRDSGPFEPIYLPKIEDLLTSLKPSFDKTGLEIRQFSDSIVLSSKYSIDNAVKIIEAAAQVQYSMIINGILVRGGIAIGRHYTNGDIVYSQALVEAYYIESKYARFPRIVIDQNLIELMLGTSEDPKQLERNYS
ncbi:hypothetical protein GA8_18390, partial [Geobacillus sp. A8]